MTKKMRARDYERCLLLTQDKLAIVRKETMEYEVYEELVETLKAAIQRAKLRETQKSAPKQRRTWKCNNCGKVTTINMKKQCASCEALDTVVAVE